MKMTALVSSVFFLFSAYISPAPKVFIHTQSLTPIFNAQATHISSKPISQKGYDTKATIACEVAAPPNEKTATKSNSQAYYIASVPFSEAEQAEIYAICAEFKVDYTLILSLIKVESNFCANSVGHNQNGTTDAGIAQINSAYLSVYAARAKVPPSQFDPMNFTHGVRALCGQIAYLEDYFAQKSDDTKQYYVLNSYNMGIGGYRNFVNTHGYLSRHYDKRVLSYQAILQREIA